MSKTKDLIQPVREIRAAFGVVSLRGGGMRKRGRLLLREWLMGEYYGKQALT